MGAQSQNEGTKSGQVLLIKTNFSNCQYIVQKYYEPKNDGCFCKYIMGGSN